MNIKRLGVLPDLLVFLGTLNCTRNLISQENFLPLGGKNQGSINQRILPTSFSGHLYRPLDSFLTYENHDFGE